MPNMIMRACDPSSKKGEAEGLPQVQSSPGLQSNTLSQVPMICVLMLSGIHM